MKKCEFEKYRVAYAGGELAETDARALETHLKICARCATAVSELKTVASILQSRERVQPSAEFLATYSQSLERIVSAPRPNPVWSDRIATAIHAFFSWRIRLAVGVALLFAGIGIGYFALRSPQPVVIFESQRIAVPQSKIIGEFITGSEIILLSLSNLESLEKVNPADIRPYQQQSEKLVRQTAQIRDAAALLNDTELNKLIINLELLLLEIANLQPDDLTQKIIEINAATNKLRIFIKVEHVQDELQRREPTPI